MSKVTKLNIQLVINLIYLTGFISLIVGLMNVLPIPALDGGRILFLIIEKIQWSK